MLVVFMMIAAEGHGQNSPQAHGNLKDVVFSSPQTTPACHTTRLAFRSVGFTPPCRVTLGQSLPLSGSLSHVCNEEAWVEQNVLSCAFHLPDPLFP